jgi:hypothetical protein
VTAVYEFGGRVNRTVLAEDLRARTDAIASQLHVAAQRVLPTYTGDDWGRQMAVTMMADVRGRDALAAAGPDEYFAMRVVGRMLAALRQAVLPDPAALRAPAAGWNWSVGVWPMIPGPAGSWPRLDRGLSVVKLPLLADQRQRHRQARTLPSLD